MGRRAHTERVGTDDLTTGIIKCGAGQVSDGGDPHTHLSSSRSSASRSCRRCAHRETACRRLSDGASAADGWSAWLTARGAAAAAASAAASPLCAALDRPGMPVCS